MQCVLLKVMDNIQITGDVTLDGQKSRLAMYMCELITIMVTTVNETTRRKNL